MKSEERRIILLFDVFFVALGVEIAGKVVALGQKRDSATHSVHIFHLP